MQSTPVRSILAILLLLAFSAGNALAAPPAAKIPAGEVFTSEVLGWPGEAFDWPADANAALLQSRLGDKLTLQDFPVAPGLRADVELERYDVYAYDTKILVDTGKAQREIPRADRLAFIGKTVDGPDFSVGFSLDPETASLRGLSRGATGLFEIREPAAGTKRHVVQHPRAALEGIEPFIESSCGADHLPADPTAPEGSLIDHIPGLSGRILPKGVAPSGLSVAVVAVDTDNELNHLKFSNDTDAALDYLFDLFAALNVIYERDLDLRLLQGTTFLRLDTDPSPTYNDDPWNVTGTVASSAHLSEFGSYWSSNQGSVRRVMAMLLSGKSSSNFSSSGIAWVDGVCETQSTGGAYSVTMVFKANVADTLVIGHELGHNFGSPHTHCYNPPVDNCYALEGGCYSGPVSCPAGGKGTIMSYCHFGSGASCGSNKLEFHPTVISNLSGNLSNHTFAGCIVPLVFNDGFQSGNTTLWSSEVP